MPEARRREVARIARTHGVLIVVNLLIAVVLGRWGLRALRSSR